MRRLTGVAFVFAFVAMCAAGARSSSSLSWQDAAKPEGSAGILKLTAEEARLVRGSKAAVVAAGFSESYFERHFALNKVVNEAGDRRVVWRFRAGEHEAFVSDSIGYFDEGGRRVDTHSVTGSLPRARDIHRTISRRRAERIMRACIGEFEGGTVVFQPFGPNARTALVLTAVTLPKPVPPPPPPAPVVTEPGADPIRRRGKRSGPLYIGAVNLETGRCLKGTAQAGAPAPEPRQQ